MLFDSSHIAPQWSRWIEDEGVTIDSGGSGLKASDKRAPIASSCIRPVF
jgi:hypothetical protein